MFSVVHFSFFQWFYVDDSRHSTLLRTVTGSAWTEYRRGEISELKTDHVVSTQQGTYQCVAVNDYGSAMSQCYLLVGSRFTGQTF